jgi:DNA-directed RNA polymerase specialized sigma24 family protein
VYQTAFRWTGNRPDAEDATEWVFLSALSAVRLPELVRVVDDRAVDATLEAVSRHWSDRYGVANPRRSAVYACEAARVAGPALTLEALLEELSAEGRLILVLRFLRKRSVAAIAAQLHLTARATSVRMFDALTGVARRIGFDTGNGQVMGADGVAGFVGDLVAHRRPARFEVCLASWAAIVAAAHVHAAVAGNDLPDIRFVRSLEHRVEKQGSRGVVTHVRIWSA